jgi:potassium channel subfamily K
MNDPGAHEPMNQVANDLEDNPYEKEEKLEKEEEEDFLDPRLARSQDLDDTYMLTQIPSRWWFASTACPLIAGTFGPMANAFSICALVVYWREYIPEGGTEAHGKSIKDPPWFVRPSSLSLDGSR